MTVRKRQWRDKQGCAREKWMIHIEHTWPDGRRQTIRKISPAQTKRGAEQYEREIRSMLVSGRWKDGKPQQQTPTLKAFSKEFLAHQGSMNKPSSVASKESMLRCHLLPALGKYPLDQIDERKIDTYAVQKLATGLAPQTVNLHFTLIKRVLRVARKWGLIANVPEINMLKARKPGFDFLTFEESEQFLSAAAEHLPEWHPYMLVAVRTGLRVGEMVALRWREDIDLDRGRLRVQQSYGGQFGFTSPKNDKARELPLTRDAREALQLQRRRVSGELVFSRAEGAVLLRQTVGRALAKVCKEAGLRRIHNHALRHTFASHAVMRGIPMRQVQEWLGHSSIVVTMRYAHLAEGSGDELIQRLCTTPDEDRPQPAEPQHMDSTEDQPRPNLTP